MKNISIIGSGNVAFHLAKAFNEVNFSVDVYSRKKDPAFEEIVTQFYELKSLSAIRNELVIICVSDDAVNEVVKQLDDSNWIAYTSGTITLDTLVSKKNLGVFYPLQTFSKERELNYFDIPFLIEANHELFAQQLFDLAWSISKNVRFAASEDRKNIHLAAVFANNFTNHLYAIAKNLLEQRQIDWKLLLPLIAETTKKVNEMDPNAAQTGPAKRNDKQTISKQLALLNPEEKEIYLCLTNHILKTFGHEKL